MLFNILSHAHSGLRWIVLLLIVYNCVNALLALQSKRAITPKDTRLSLFGMLSVHVQALLGIILYMQSPNVQFSASTMSDSHIRFFTVEHVFGMLIVVILVTLAHRRNKAAVADHKKISGVFWYFAITLLIMLVSIPWPFRGFGNGWM